MNLDILGLEQVIDHYHQSEIEKMAQLKNLDKEVDSLKLNAKMSELLDKKLAKN